LDKGKVLIVDDSKAMRNVLKNLLEHKGFATDEAADGKFALTIEKDQYKLIILDIMMPEVNGEEALMIMKKRNINIPVIVVSAVINKDLIPRLLKLNVKSIMSKPVSVNRFYEEINKII